MSAESNRNSESKLLRGLKAGDKLAANEIISRFYERVVRAADRRLEGCVNRATSGEDVAASVFESLWKRADNAGFADEELKDCDELWRLLCKITSFKTLDHMRREKAQKRGGGEVRGESVFMKPNEDSQNGLGQIADDFESVCAVVGFREEFERMIAALEDQTLSEIVMLRLEGSTVKEIATHFDRSDRWVKRKLALIRDSWGQMVDADNR